MHRILVVDDDADIRDSLELMLSLEGYDVVSAGEGASALAIAEREDFSAAIVDICMPGMSGPETILALREQAPDMPLIAVTGLPLDDERTGRRFSAASGNFGAAHALPKPFEPEDLLGLLQSCCASAH